MTYSYTTLWDVTDLFGELSILDGLERSANVIAIEDSEVYFIERGDFQELIQRYPALSVHLLQQLAGRIRASDQQIEFLALGDARSKVFRTLVRIAEDIGLSRSESDMVIGGSLSQQDLADMAGTSRETISRTLKNLEDEGLISRSGDSIYLHDFPELQTMSRRPSRSWQERIRQLQ